MKILIAISLIFIMGCAGTGFNKQCTLTPDEVWVSSDFDREWKASEFTGGAKWKIR